MRRMLLAACAAALAVIPGVSWAAELRYALPDDPDTLDPHLNRSAAGIAVITAVCERLLVSGEGLKVMPGLAQSWEWSPDGMVLTLKLTPNVKFHDGTPFNAAAVKYNLDRARTIPGSQRKDDVGTIAEVTPIDDLTVAIKLKSPDVSVLAKLAEKAGFIISPTAAEAEGDKFGSKPVCTGPYIFTERVAQDRIVVDKWADYRNADAYKVDRITFRIVPDDAIRLVNLQAGDIDLMDRLDPSAAAQVESDSALQLIQLDTLNYQSLVLNMRGAAAELPMSKDVRVREAFDLAIDRQAIVDVAFAGRYVAGNQFVPPSNPYYSLASPVVPRDVEKAKKILVDAGYNSPVPFTLLVPNRPLAVRVAEMLQAMTNEAGFDTKLNVVDFATTLNLTDQGNFEAWGPIGVTNANDPDAAFYVALHSNGNRNVGKYNNPEMDKLADASRREIDLQKRIEIVHKIGDLIVKDKALIYLYHVRPLLAARSNVHGIHATGDGFLLFDGVTVE